MSKVILKSIAGVLLLPVLILSLPFLLIGGLGYMVWIAIFEPDDCDFGL